jgi:tRNA-2-methylthio-N6-dimethylallyladenosine synthase
MMNRGYTREWYINRIDSIKRIIPDCTISADIISGFCSETEEEHQETLSLMNYVRYHFAYMFKYSERPNTLAQRKYDDDIPEATKQRRLAEIIKLQRQHSHELLQKDVGKTYEVLVEGISKKSDQELYGRTTHNSVVVFPKEQFKLGDYVMVKVESCTSATLKGKAII